MDIEQIFLNIHLRIVRAITSVIPKSTRLVVEHLTLAVAFVFLAIFAWFHWYHVYQEHRPSAAVSCFPKLASVARDIEFVEIQVVNSWPENETGELVSYQVQSFESLPARLSKLSQLGAGEQEAVVAALASAARHEKEAIIEALLADPSKPAADGGHAHSHTHAETLAGMELANTLASALNAHSHAHSSSSSAPSSAAFDAATRPVSAHAAASPVFQFSRERGYFTLGAAALTKHKMQRLNVTISSSHPCLGSTLMQVLAEDHVGYDTILMNQLIRAFGEGFLLNTRSRELYSLHFTSYSSRRAPNQPWPAMIFFKLELFLTVLFLFFAVTALVSFTLRQTQIRMLHFTGQLRMYMRSGLPFGRLVALHVLESIGFVPVVVGVLFFLFEFLNDQLLAFLVLLTAWLCEMFTVVCVRTRISVRFFPRMFGMYFLFFGVYFFGFPYGFHYMAMLTCGLFLFHSMVHFWNRYEVPAVECGAISSVQPRQLPAARSRVERMFGGGNPIAADVFAEYLQQPDVRNAITAGEAAQVIQQLFQIVQQQQAQPRDPQQQQARLPLPLPPDVDLAAVGQLEQQIQQQQQQLGHAADAQSHAQDGSQLAGPDQAVVLPTEARNANTRPAVSSSMAVSVGAQATSGFYPNAQIDPQQSQSQTAGAAHTRSQSFPARSAGAAVAPHLDQIYGQAPISVPRRKANTVGQPAQTVAAATGGPGLDEVKALPPTQAQGDVLVQPSQSQPLAVIPEINTPPLLPLAPVDTPVAEQASLAQTTATLLTEQSPTLAPMSAAASVDVLSASQAQAQARSMMNLQAQVLEHLQRSLSSSMHSMNALLHAQLSGQPADLSVLANLSEITQELDQQLIAQRIQLFRAQQIQAHQQLQQLQYPHLQLSSTRAVSPPLTAGVAGHQGLTSAPLIPPSVHSTTAASAAASLVGSGSGSYAGFVAGSSLTRAPQVTTPNPDREYSRAFGRAVLPSLPLSLGLGGGFFRTSASPSVDASAVSQPSALALSAAAAFLPSSVASGMGVQGRASPISPLPVTPTVPPLSPPRSRPASASASAPQPQSQSQTAPSANAQPQQPTPRAVRMSSLLGRDDAEAAAEPAPSGRQTQQQQPQPVAPALSVAVSGNGTETPSSSPTAAADKGAGKPGVMCV